jgi:hypothetical protein
VVSVDERWGSVGVRLTGSTIPERGDGLVFRMTGEEESESGMVLRQKPVIDAGILWLKAGPGARQGLMGAGIRRGAGGEGIQGRMAGGGIRRGSRVFITRRASRAGTEVCSSAGGSRVRVDLALTVGDDRKPVLEGSVSRSGVPMAIVRREGGFWAEPARARELSGDEVREILSKKGDAPYPIGRVSVTWPPGTYARKGDIGGLRRDLLAEVERELIRAGRPDPKEVEVTGSRLEKALRREGISDRLPRGWGHRQPWSCSPIPWNKYRGSWMGDPAPSRSNPMSPE